MLDVSIVPCTEAQRSLLERSDSGISPNGPTFAYDAIKLPRNWHLAVFLHKDFLFGVGVVRRGAKATDLEFRLHIAAFRSMRQLRVGSIAVELKHEADLLRRKGVLTEARGRKILAVLIKLVPEVRSVIEELSGWAERQAIPGPAGVQLALERDALGTALEVAGMQRSFLTRWQDQGTNTPFLNGLPLAYDEHPPLSATSSSETLELPRVQALEQIEVSEPSQTWVNEDQLIMFDHNRFGDWLGLDGEHHGWRNYENYSGTQRINVYYANRTPVESALGVDLVYFNERHGCCVLVQYKKMTPDQSTGRLGYRPDSNLAKELERMESADELCRQVEHQRPYQDYRLISSPSFVKVCEPQALVTSSSEWVKGMYLARDQFSALLQSPASKGPRGGIRLTYSNVPRYLNATTFTTLLKDGWIGSRNTATDRLKIIIQQTLASGRSAMFTVHASDKPFGNQKTNHKPG